MKVILLGRLDTIVEVEKMGSGIFHLQHKTMSAYTNIGDYLTKMGMAWHEKAYTWLARENGIPMKGSIINVLRKLKVPTRTRQKTIDGVKKKWTEEKEDLTGWNPFVRHRVVNNEGQIEDFLDDLRVVAKLIKTADRWMNRDSCVKYSRECPYLPLCKGGLVDKDTLYEKREPDYVDEEQGKNDSAFVLNVSRMMDYARCPMYYYYRWEEGIVPVSMDRTKLDFGSMIHRGLEVYYAPGEGQRPKCDIEGAISSMEEWAEENEFEGTGVESLDYGRKLMKRYHEVYGNVDRETMKIIGREVELTGEVEVKM